MKSFYEGDADRLTSIQHRETFLSHDGYVFMLASGDIAEPMESSAEVKNEGSLPKEGGLCGEANERVLVVSLKALEL